MAAKTTESSSNTPSATVRNYIAQLAKANEDSAIMGIRTSIESTKAKAPAEALRRVN